MTKSIEEYISELLFLHDCVIIPDFGGFIGNEISAVLNKQTGEISPPSKKILFNINLKTNDGLLISYISSKEQISQNIIKEKIRTFVNEINFKLSQSKVFRLNKIGLFTSGKEGNIHFIQDKSINYNIAAFGMKPVYKQAAERTNPNNKKLDATVDKIKNLKKRPKIAYRAAAVLLPLILLSYLSVWQEEKINEIYTQMASFFPFNQKESIKKNKLIAKNKESISTPETNIKHTTKPIVSQKKYYIIAGAFREKQNAYRMLNKLKNWNYSAEILKGSDLIRVSYSSFNEKENARVLLKEIRKENATAWILTK